MPILAVAEWLEPKPILASRITSWQNRCSDATQSRNKQRQSRRLYHQPSSLFAATIFLAGALAGMGGLVISQRVNAAPRSFVQRESLKKPLLVAKAEPGYEEGTVVGGARFATRYASPLA